MIWKDDKYLILINFLHLLYTSIFKNLSVVIGFLTSFFHLNVEKNPLDFRHYLKTALCELEFSDSCGSLGRECAMCRQLGHIAAFLPIFPLWTIV